MNNQWFVGIDVVKSTLSIAVFNGIKFSNYFLVFLFINIFLFSCRSNRSKEKHDFTKALCDKRLYVEVYKIFESGAYGGDKVSNYLTDSGTFRIYIGCYDNGYQFYSYECKGDTVYVYKGEGKSGKNKILTKNTFLITDLKRKGKFE